MIKRTTNITTEDIFNFFQGNAYYYVAKYNGSNGIPVHVLEQALYRAYKCPECLVEKKCNSGVCSCVTPHMFFATEKEDGRQRWGKMMDPESWNKFKSWSDEWKEICNIIFEREGPDYALDFGVYFNKISKNYLDNKPSISSDSANVISTTN